MILACPVGQQRIVEECEDIAVLFFACGDGCPNALTPAHVGIATRALSDSAVNHGMTNLTLRTIVGRLNGRVRQKAKISLGGSAFESPCQVFRKLMARRSSHSLQKVLLDPAHSFCRPGIRPFVATTQRFE